MRIEHRNGYHEHKELAQFIERSYYGGDKYREGRYLNRRDLESDEKYAKRLKSAVYTNFCRPVQDAYLDFLFGANWHRDFGALENEPVWQSFYEDMDGAGRGYIRFWQHAMLRASLQGFCAIVVDKPQVQAETRAQELEQGARPYCALYDGTDIVHAEFKRVGWKRELYRIVLAEPSDEEGVEVFREWTADAWTVYRQQKPGGAEVKESGPNPLGVIPVVILQAQAGGLLEANPDLKDIAVIARKLYNIDADIEEVRANTAFPFLEVPEKRDEHGELIVVGTGNALTYDPENPSARHAYIEPAHTSIQVMLQERDRALSDLRFLSRLPFDVTGEARQVPSGYALRVLSEKLNALLRSKARMLADAERKVVGLFAKWQGTTAEAMIKAPDHFGIDDANEQLDLATKALAVSASPTLRKELAKKAARLTLGEDIDAEVLARIESEVGTNIMQELIGGDQGA